MAKVKSIEFDICGVREKFDIKVNSKGVFFIDIPKHLTGIFEEATNRQNIISNSTLDGLERQFSDVIVKYQNTKVVKDLFIKIYYHASMEYARKADGDRLFPSSGSEYNIQGFNMDSSSLSFDFEVLMRVTRDETVTWYETSTYKGPDGDRFSSITRQREMVKTGDIIESRKMHYFEANSGLIPYSDAMIVKLTHIREELRKISETLFNLVRLDPIKLEEAILNIKLIG